MPFWRSELATQFIDFLETHRSTVIPRLVGLNGRPRRGAKPRPRRRRQPPLIDYDTIPPSNLPEDWYNPAYLARLTFEDTLKLKMAPPMFPASGNFLCILPSTKDVTLYDSAGTAFIPPHLSNIPLSQSQASQILSESALKNPQFNFTNHTLFSAGTSASASAETSAGVASTSKAPGEDDDLNSLFDGINSDVDEDEQMLGHEQT